MNPDNIKRFTRKAREASDADEFTSETVFVIDGITKPGDKDPVTFTASRPKDAAFLMVAAAADNPANAMMEMSRFIDSCLPADQRKLVSDALRDPESDFDIDSLGDIFEYLVETFTTRPTESQSDS